MGLIEGDPFIGVAAILQEFDKIGCVDQQRSGIDTRMKTQLLCLSEVFVNKEMDVFMRVVD